MIETLAAPIAKIAKAIPEDSVEIAFFDKDKLRVDKLLPNTSYDVEVKVSFGSPFSGKGRRNKLIALYYSIVAASIGGLVLEKETSKLMEITSGQGSVAFKVSTPTEITTDIGMTIEMLQGGIPIYVVALLNSISLHYSISSKSSKR